MSWRLIPICCVIFAFIAQIVFIGFSKTEHMYLYLEKTLIFAWFLWMMLAFYYDKDIPIPGDFAFKTNNPEQQTGRGFATIAMTLLYIIIVGYDIKKMLP
jgi:hypothetical protein